MTKSCVSRALHTDQGLSGRSNITVMAEVESEAQVGNLQSTRDDAIDATHAQ